VHIRHKQRFTSGPINRAFRRENKLFARDGHREVGRLQILFYFAFGNVPSANIHW
jgi:hypothetical protein